MLWKFLLATLFSLAFAAPGAASEQDDIAYIVDRLVSRNDQETHRQLALAYLHVHEDWLRERSVRVVDEDRFAAVFPHVFTQQRVDELRDVIAGDCLAKFSADEIHDAAEVLRQTPVDAGKEWDSDAKGQSVITAAGLCWMLGSLKLAESIRMAGETPSGDNMAYLADVLDAKGVAAFPNRIVRRTVLEELRNTGR